ncbi:MAG: ligand-binding sensor domain-containing protein, partial [Candidatus Hermodarchaeia archaeon]
MRSVKRQRMFWKRIIPLLTIIAISSLPKGIAGSAEDHPFSDSSVSITAPSLQQPPINIRFETLSMEDGLSQNSVITILQDYQGFMWFGTEDGLNKYDGHQFTVYKHDPENAETISDNLISKIYEDSSGNLW